VISRLLARPLPPAPHPPPRQGALAKIGATVVTYPMIVVKSRLQVGWTGHARAHACVRMYGELAEMWA
jgi:hypothetical protein